MKVLVFALYALSFFTCSRTGVVENPHLNLFKLDNPKYYCTVKIKGQVLSPPVKSVPFKAVEALSSHSFLRNRFVVLHNFRNKEEVEVVFAIKSSQEALQHIKNIVKHFSQHDLHISSVALSPPTCGPENILDLAVTLHAPGLEQKVYVMKYPAASVNQWLEELSKSIQPSQK